MKQKNTESSVGMMLATGLFIMIVSLLVGAVLVGVFRGTLMLIDPSQPLPRQFLRWAVILGAGVGIKHAGASLWLWWTELRNAINSAGGRAVGWWKKPLTALVLLGLIASGPFWLNIHIDADGPEIWMVLYALYLLFAGLVTILPCSLIYGLGRSLAEKELEKEELDEAKKY